VALEDRLRGRQPALPGDLLDVGFDQDQSPAAAGLQDWWDKVFIASPYYRQSQVVENGQTLGRIGYFVRRSRLGFKWARKPDWAIPKALCLHPLLAPERRAQIVETLVEQLPRHNSFYLVFTEDPGWSQETIAAFTRRGFEHARASTYQWRPDDGDVLALMKSKARSQLKLAEKRLEIVEIGAEAFLSYYGQNLALGKARLLRPLPLAKALLDAAAAQNRVRITAARTPSGSMDAAIACTWDDDRYYYWMSSHRPHIDGCKPHKDAGKVLVLDAMRHARSLGLIFDTDGTGSAGSEHLYRDILKLQRAEIRHVFRRTTRLAACYSRCRPILLGLKRKIYRAG
jgi:hypothetical protein